MDKIYTYSEAGNSSGNEDFLLVERHPVHEELILGAVADGQGGRPGGAKAAEIACTTAIQHAREYKITKLLRPNAWVDIVRSADRAVADDEEAGYTTLVAFCLSRTWVTGASNGDSAAVIIGKSEHDNLTSQQVKNPPIGSRDAAVVSFTSSISPPSIFIAMSDGVWKYAGWNALFSVRIEKDAQEIGTMLADKARLARTKKFQDDFSLIIIPLSATRIPGT